MIIILMGVAGCGKTTIGELLAEKLSLPFHDADDFHPESNVEKMASGIPLTDEDRWPWLDSLTQVMPVWEENSGGAVLACSALREVYRDQLSRGSTNVVFVYLQLSREILFQRLKTRPGHYMKPEMLESQLATLEEPVKAVIIEAEKPIDEVVSNICKYFEERALS